MKWIKYQIVCNEDKDILLDKKVGYSEANLAIAQNEAYNGEYTIEDDGKSFDKEPIPIEGGGTGADNADDARTNLGAASISHNQSAESITSGMFAGQVTANTAYQNPNTLLVRNSVFVKAGDTIPQLNEGETCWIYK